MSLADHVRVARRFQRAVRIDTDLGSPSALEGFVCPRSCADLLENMARHMMETGQGAFTWTGPYGSGKSSLAVALSALVGGDAALRERAQAAVGAQTAQAVSRAFLPPPPPAFPRVGAFFPLSAAGTTPTRSSVKPSRPPVS